MSLKKTLTSILTAGALALSGCGKTEFTKQDFYKKNSVAVEIYPLGECILQDIDGDRIVDIVMARGMDHIPLYVAQGYEKKVNDSWKARPMPENVREAVSKVYQDLQDAGIEIAKDYKAYKGD